MVFYTIVKTIVVYPERCLYICIITCAEIIIYNTRPFFLCKLFDSMSYKYIIIEESGKGGIILYQTPDGQTSLEVKLEK